MGKTITNLEFLYIIEFNHKAKFVATPFRFWQIRSWIGILSMGAWPDKNVWKCRSVHYLAILCMAILLDSKVQSVRSKRTSHLKYEKHTSWPVL